MKIKVMHPQHGIGETIRSDRYMGEVTGAFFDKDEWCYIIGENAGDFDDLREGYKMGSKFIRQSEIVACIEVEDGKKRAWVAE